MTHLLTLPFSDRDGKSVDTAEAWALCHERALRELRYRDDHDIVAEEAPLAVILPARDAGDVCGVCGQEVTWVDHLPPNQAGGAVRCFANVRQLRRDVEIDDIFPKVGT